MCHVRRNRGPAQEFLQDPVDIPFFITPPHSHFVFNVYRVCTHESIIYLDPLKRSLSCDFYLVMDTYKDPYYPGNEGSSELICYVVGSQEASAAPGSRCCRKNTSKEREKRRQGEQQQQQVPFRIASRESKCCSPEPGSKSGSMSWSNTRVFAGTVCLMATSKPLTMTSRRSRRPFGYRAARLRF